MTILERVIVTDLMTMNQVTVCHVPPNLHKNDRVTSVPRNKQVMVKEDAMVDTELMCEAASDIGPVTQKEQRVILNGGSAECEQDEEMGEEPDSSCHTCVPDYYKQPPSPPGSPMCIAEENSQFDKTRKTSSMMELHTDTDKGSSRYTGGLTMVPGRKSYTTLPRVYNTGDKRIHQPFGSTPSLFYARTPFPSLGHNSPVHHAVRPYSQTPSPVFPGPKSSCSSRSSQSPAQSPLLNRLSSGLTSAPYFNCKSPELHQQSIGVTADHTISSQQKGPQQVGGSKCNKVEVSFFSPSQSPNHGRHHYPDGSASFSPNSTSTQGREAMLSRPVPFGDSPSPTLLHQNQQGFERPPSSVYEDRSTFSEPTSHTSPLLHQSSFEIQSAASTIASSASDESNASDFAGPLHRLSTDNSSDESRVSLMTDTSQGSLSYSGATGGISRQQLLSGPCPICGDRISGFHYGIFSCESCKGFFKRTVQNKKNYVCLRGANCQVAMNTRKKCPACRFNKCLKMGMKLEAIREDRTRGGRSTYHCSYSLPSQPVTDPWIPSGSESFMGPPHTDHMFQTCARVSDGHNSSPASQSPPYIPQLIQEIMSVEHLWHHSEKEMTKVPEQLEDKSVNGESDYLTTLCKIADDRLYKIVKWCKSLPLFKEIQRDDQIALLINSWCEMLLLSCCYRSMSTPNEICISRGKPVTLQQAEHTGLGPVIERMLNLTEHLRTLQVDQHEFVCLKVIILLTSDVSGLKEPDKVRTCQKQVLQALQLYTRIHYPHLPSKLGELLLRIPELERACQMGKESLASKQRGGEVPSFHLLMELLRGDH